jgi:hypothetical protein
MAKTTKNNENAKPKVHKDLEGLEITIDKFGQIKTSYDIDTINEFLNKNTDDKKFKKKEK